MLLLFTQMVDTLSEKFTEKFSKPWGLDSGCCGVKWHWSHSIIDSELVVARQKFCSTFVITEETNFDEATKVLSGWLKDTERVCVALVVTREAEEKGTEISPTSQGGGCPPKDSRSPPLVQNQWHI